MLSKVSSAPQKLEVKTASRGKDLHVFNDYCAPKKIACGHNHTLYIACSKRKEDDGDDDIVEMKVYGWGSNRHNVLGLNKENRPDYDAVRYEESHGDVGTAPWKLQVDMPTDDAFSAQDPKGESMFRKAEIAAKEGSHGHGGKVHRDPKLARERAADMEIFEVSCGTNHSMVLEKRWTDGSTLKESRLWSFGLQAHGRLGRGRPKIFTKNEEESDDSDVESVCDYPEEVFGDDLVISGFGDMRVKPVVQRVCCGGDHTLAIVNVMGPGGERPVAQGRVFAWGLQSHGALGVAKKQDRWLPTEVWFPGEYEESSTRNVSIMQVACGNKHSMALTHEGKVFSWGHGGNGRLGLGRITTSLGQSYSAEFLPRDIEKLADTKIIYIACGESHSGAVDQLGGLHTWGAGSYGRCGHGMLLDTVYPARVETLLGTAIAQIGFGLMHSIAVTYPGQLYAWGKGPATGLDRGDNESIGVPTAVPLEGNYNNPIVQVSTGPMHTMLLMEDGAMFVFGSGSENRMPKLGRHASKDVSCPKKLEGQGFSQALLDERSGHKGENRGKKERDKHPKMPMQLAAGGSNSAAVLHNGELWIWGSSVLAKNVDPPPANHDIDAPKEDEKKVTDSIIWFPQHLRKGFRAEIVKIAIGQDHALALTREKKLFAWGEGKSGQLGTGDLQRTEVPQLVTNLSEVCQIAAGEEHSAIIIEGGECYSWGAAGGGRLGLGATMNEGVQMLPEQVKIKVPGTKDLRLSKLSCGSAHTLFISEDHRVLACGAGWFGRLGQGTQDYSYSPDFIKNSDEILASEVHCASYHSCVVDQQKGLWIMGRDTSCCQPPGRHLLEPEKFQPFESPNRRYIFAIACSDSHTLAITSQRPDTRHGTELWAWGKNSRGQLGISETEAPNIDLPWQLRLPGEGVKWHKFALVATTSWHSLVVVEGKGQASNNFEVYSWGFSGSGRLGHKIISGEEQGGNDTEAIAKAGHALVRSAATVDVRWKTREMTVSARRPDRDEVDPPTGRKFDELLQTATTRWYDLQVRLHAEDPEQKKQKLLEKGKQVTNSYMDFMNDIEKLWDKPNSDTKGKTEWHIRQLQRQVESQYLRTLQVLTLSNSVHAPRIETLMKTEEEVMQKLHHFEELFWILQQQPLYLCNLASNIALKKRDELECVIFHRVVGNLFKDLQASRTRNLFKALVRTMAVREMDKVSEVGELFDPVKSRVYPLFRHMCVHPHWFESIAKKILDPEDPHSLMHTIIRYSMTKDGRNMRKDTRNKDVWLSGILASNIHEYEDREQYYRQKRCFPPRSEEEKGKGRQYFQDELKDFGKFVNGLGGTEVHYDKEVNEDEMTDEELRTRFDGPAGRVALLDEHGWRRMRKEKHWREGNRTQAQEEELRQRVMALMHGSDWKEEMKTHLCLDVPFIKDFVSHFIKKVLGDKDDPCLDFQMLLVHMFQNLSVEKYAIQYRKSDENTWQPELMMPIASIILGSMIGGVLFEVKKGPFALMRMKIDKYIEKMETQILRESTADPAVDPLLDKDLGLVDRVWWNVEHLALFFERCVHKQVYEEQVKKPMHATPEDLQKFAEETAVRDAAQELTRHTCNVLMHVLDGVGTEVYHKDETETQLTVDLYTSHFSMDQHIVSMSTSDMLHWTNMLHDYMEQDPRNPEHPAIRTDKPENDRVYKLVEAILPKEVRDDRDKQKARTIKWSDGSIAVAQNGGEMHNFTMAARFLEFRNSGPEEPTFCEVTQAPIPRSLAKEDQKKRSGVRVVKPLRSDRGQVTDIPGIGNNVYPYEELMLLLEDLSGSSKGDRASDAVNYRINGTNFTDLRTSFEDIQRKISAEMAEISTGAAHHAELLQRLENGKAYVGKIRESVEEKDLREYMERELRKRNEYKAYLNSLGEGTKTIDHAKEKYKKDLEETYKRLVELDRSTEVCDLPEEIIGALQVQSERPKFSDAKKSKLRKAKTDPTPARKVLDELMRTSGDSGKETLERLKEMVGFPARTFTRAELEKKGVLTQLNDMIPNNVKKDLKFSFQFDKEAYYVKAFVKSTMLREFVITREDIQLLDRGCKNAIKSYGDGFVSLNCFRLRRLLAFIMAEGGL